MIHAPRAHALVDLHARLRKEAMAACVDPVVGQFREADAALGGAKTAAEVARVPPHLLRHLTSP